MIKNLKEGELEVQINESAGRIEMKWLGKSRNPNPSAFLVPYLEETAGGIGGREIYIDFSMLEFMNSSTVTSIIQFVKTIGKGNINATVAYNKGSEWQCASFKALETIVMTMKNITIMGV